jgi:hypothetical protein
LGLKVAFTAMGFTAGGLAGCCADADTGATASIGVDLWTVKTRLALLAKSTATPSICKEACSHLTAHSSLVIWFTHACGCVRQAIWFGKFKSSAHAVKAASADNWRLEKGEKVWTLF